MTLDDLRRLSERLSREVAREHADICSEDVRPLLDAVPLLLDVAEAAENAYLIGIVADGPPRAILVAALAQLNRALEGSPT